MVCGRHFRQEDKLWSAGPLRYKRLKEGAVPTIFPWSTEDQLATSDVNDKICANEQAQPLQK